MLLFSIRVFLNTRLVNRYLEIWISYSSEIFYIFQIAYLDMVTTWLLTFVYVEKKSSGKKSNKLLKKN